MWSAVVSQDTPNTASNVASFPALPTIPGSPSRESKAASTTTGSFHTAAVSPVSAITQQPSVTLDQLSSLTDSIEALKKENLKQKEEFEILLDDHKTIVHDAMVDGQEKLALYVKKVVAMSMERSYTASAYDLSCTANILNANSTLIRKMISRMTSQTYTPLELPSPESGPSQEGATILADAAHSIGLIPLPL